MLNNVVNVPDAPKGKGLLGSIVGGVLGLGAAIAAPFTAGTSAAAIPAIAGAAAPLATMGVDALTGANNTGSAPAPSVAHTDTNKMPLNSMGSHPEVMMAGLQEAKNALKDTSLPADQFEGLHSQFSLAQNKLKQQIGI